jgi:hypothetical protein
VCDNTHRTKTRTSPTSPSAGPVSDEALKRATGRDWAEWCRLLDGAGAKTLTHAEIARMVHDRFNGGDWWSQMVTVGYERMRGLRSANQRRSGSFEVSKSKTIAAPINRVYEAWHPAAKRKRWLANPSIDVTSATPSKTMRFGWVDGKSRAAAYFVSKGEKTAVTVQHAKLADAKTAEKMKKYWGTQLEALDAELTR